MDWPRFQNATALRDSGRGEEALWEFRQLESETDGADERAALLINEHGCFCNLGRLEEAEEVLAQIHKLAPTDRDVCLVVDFGEASMHAQMGHLERSLGEFDEILRRYSDLLEVSERGLFERIQRRRGVALCNLSKHAEAIPILNYVLECSSISSEDRQEAHLYLGVCYDEIREQTRAKEEYLKAISLGLKTDLEAHARYRVAVLYFSAGAFAQAKLHLEAILEEYRREISNLSKQSVRDLLSRTCRSLGEKS